MEEIKREAAQDGKPVSGLLSVTTDVCPGVQTSALDVVSALSANCSVVTPLLDNVSPCMASVRMAPAARGGKPVVSMMPEDHESANHLEDGSLVQSVTVLSKDCSSARDSGDILSVDDTLDSVQCSAIRESPSPCDSVSSDLMTTHPSIASQLEKTKLLHLNSVQTAAKQRMVFHLIVMLLWTLYFNESFLGSCRKSGKFLSVRDNAFQGSL